MKYLLMLLIVFFVGCSYPQEEQAFEINTMSAGTGGELIADGREKLLHVLMTDSGTYVIRNRDTDSLLFYGEKRTHEDTVVAFVDYCENINLIFTDSSRVLENGIVGLAEVFQPLYLWYSDYWKKDAFGKSITGMPYYKGEISPNWTIYKGVN